MGWRGRLILGLTGLVTAIFAWSINSELLDRIAKSIILIGAAFLLLSTVAWRKLTDQTLDENDIAGWIAGILGIFVLIGGIFTLVGFSFDADWFVSLYRYAGVVTGAFIITLAAMSSD